VCCSADFPCSAGPDEGGTNSHQVVLYLHLMPLSGSVESHETIRHVWQSEIGIDRLTRGTVGVRKPDDNEVRERPHFRTHEGSSSPKVSRHIFEVCDGTNVVSFAFSARCRRANGSQPCAK